MEKSRNSSYLIKIRYLLTERMSLLESKIFALDIGTRSVVGIILQELGDAYHVADLLAIEHKERSMIDGQIHNVLSVTHVISEIKSRLEEKHGPLHRVSVAAAGRALKTVEGMMTADISQGASLSEEDIHLLELSAVQKAQTALLSQEEAVNKSTTYYCVGYSVLHYKVDGESIGSLLDQSGSTASVEVIATFLPQVVIDSLLSALKRAGLEMEALTLEPIAAIQVLIPPSMRRLNVALVDIGAGTSDIALTDQNTITAYGMVPIAGDEITETLSSEYLLDFPLAEQMKRQLSTHEEVTVQDILGFEEQIPVADVNAVLQPTVETLANAIGDEIFRLNGGIAPKAVILIGGGSLTPKLPERLCAKLDLPQNRVAIRGLDAIAGVTTEASIPNSPDLITPIGIAIAARQAPIHYMTVTVNGRVTRLFDMQSMTISDALLSSNISPRQLYGKPGHGMTVTFNGQDIIIPGEHGTAPTLQLNGHNASVKDPIQNGDRIEVVPGEKGQDATANAMDLIEDVEEIHVFLNNQTAHLKPVIRINATEVDPYTIIQDRDKIQVQQDFTLEAALKQLNIPSSNEKFTVYVDNQPYAVQHQEIKYFLDDIEITKNKVLSNHDHITMEFPKQPTIADLAKDMNLLLTEQITIVFNGEKMIIRKNRMQASINGQIADENTILQQQDNIQFTEIDPTPIVFSDVFAFTNYQLPTDQVGKYKLLRNGQPIAFNEQIFGGDQLEITFSIK